MPRRKSNIGRRTRKAKAMQRLIANRTEEERALANEQNRLRKARVYAKESAEQRAARLEKARLRARQLRSAASKKLRSQQNECSNIVEAIILTGPFKEIMEMHYLLPSNNIKMEPDFEERQSSNIKLEPVSETDSVHMTAKEIINESQVFGQMESITPASVKIEQPEVYVDYPGQEICPSSENYSPISERGYSQADIFGSAELLKQELPHMLYESRNRQFSKMLDTTFSDIIQELPEYSKAESRFNKNGCVAINQEHLCQDSQNIFSVTENYGETTIS